MQLVQWGVIAYSFTFQKSGVMEVYRKRLWEATLDNCSRAFARVYRTFEKEKEEEKAWNATTRR